MMTTEIKTRIAAINSGKVPEGYKKTKVGIVPVEWETVRLKTISKHCTEKNKNLKYRETYTNSATQGIIKQTDYFDKQISNNENIDGYYVVRQNDYVYNPRISVSAPCGPISKSHFSETGVMSPLYTVFRLNDEYEDNGYIEHYFKSSFWYRYMSSVANYGARHDRMNITNEDLFNMPIPFPPLPEQQKIAEILSAQDKLIELQEKKIEQLKKLKKAYLQKMFPKKGSKYPELRFKGFTDAWEQRELRTAATFSKGSGYSKNDLKENGTPIILYGRLYTKYETVISEVDTFVDVQQNSVFSTGHEVVVPASGETAEDISRASFVAKSGILLGGDLNIITPAEYIHPVFLALTISNGNQQKELSKRAQGKSVVHIHNSDLEKVVLLYPSYEEQEKIGTYFSKLDNLITLHQRKSEQEKQKKKALMQLLLTGKVRCV